MKRVCVVGSLLLSLLLSACGDNWLAGGASLGGTGGGAKPSDGTHTGVDEGNGSQNPINQQPGMTQVVKYINYNLPAQDVCGVVQRHMYFVNSKLQPIEGNIQDQFDGNVRIKVDVVNTASYPVFEKQRDCKPVFDLQNMYDDGHAETILPRRTLSCEGDESWRVYKPQQKYSYIMEAGDTFLSDDITLGRIQQYKVLYSPLYVQQKLPSLPDSDTSTVSCAALVLSFNTVNKEEPLATAPVPDEAEEDTAP